MADGEQLSPEHKALSINLDNSIYGVIAEIGAGQEVARHFFRAGGASGTIAKTISAYDMNLSDAFYGKVERYVSRERLLNMLDIEYAQLVERLRELRGQRTRFFVFGDTVAARSFRGANECHGWMGVRLQLKPEGPPHDIIMHVRMKDRELAQQQQALGVVGVNLLYEAYRHFEDIDTFVRGLLDHLSIDRMEIDMLEWRGPSFEHLDNRIISLKLVQYELTHAVMFGPDREVLQPSEVLHKKPVLIQRGTFRPVTHVNIDMQNCALRQFKIEPALRGKEPVALMEISFKNLLSQRGALQPDDFVARADMLSALGYRVLISDYPQYYRLASYIRRYTSEMLGIVMGINNMLQIFDEQYYQELEGGILESFGRLFRYCTKLYVYPMSGKVLLKYIQNTHLLELIRLPSEHEFISVENAPVPEGMEHLYLHLVAVGWIESLLGYNADLMSISSREAIERFLAGDSSWEQLVPEAAARIVKERMIMQRQR